jgi:hypothetical protein
MVVNEISRVSILGRRRPRRIAAAIVILSLRNMRWNRTRIEIRWDRSVLVHAMMACSTEADHPLMVVGLVGIYIVGQRLLTRSR